MSFTVTQQVDDFLKRYRDLSRAGVVALVQEVFDDESRRLRLSNDSEDFALVANQRAYPFDTTKATVIRAWDAALVYDSVDPSPIEKVSVRRFETGQQVPRVMGSGTPFSIYQEMSSGAAKQVALYPPPATSTLVVSAASNASPIVVTTTSVHGLSDGSAVYIQDVQGNTAANGSFYARASSPYGSTTTFSLYSDSAFASPVVGNGAWTSGGLVAIPTSPFMRVWVTRRIVLGEASNTTSLPDSILSLDYLSAGAWLKHASRRHKGDVPELTGLWDHWQTKMRGEITSLFPDVVPRFEPYIRRTAQSLTGRSKLTGNDARTR